MTNGNSDATQTESTAPAANKDEPQTNADSPPVKTGAPRADGSDPLGKSALFSAPVAEAGEPTPQDVRTRRPKSNAKARAGKAALFSDPQATRKVKKTSPIARSKKPDPADHKGMVCITCSACETRTWVSPMDALVRTMLFALWIPGKRHSRWIRCPACDKRNWCTIRWSSIL